MLLTQRNDMDSVLLGQIRFTHGLFWIIRVAVGQNEHEVGHCASVAASAGEAVLANPTAMLRKVNCKS